MRSRIWQLAVAAVLAISGMASAQTADLIIDKSLPSVPSVPTATQAAPAPMAAPAAAPATAAQPVSPIIIHGQGGCTNCGTPATSSYASCDPCSTGKRSLLGGGLLSSLKIGSGCANPVDCGSCASEKTFVFGSCRQFYNPGNDCWKHGFGGGCGAGGCGHGGGCKKCGLIPPGPGGLGAPICVYGSYLMR